MRKMKQQKTKIRIEKDMNSFKERVSMKEETTTPKKLLSHKGGYRKKSQRSQRKHMLQVTVTKNNQKLSICFFNRLTGFTIIVYIKMRRYYKPLKREVDIN